MTRQRDWVAELKAYQAEVQPTEGLLGIPKWLNADRRAIVSRVYNVPQQAAEAREQALERWTRSR